MQRSQGWGKLVDMHLLLLTLVLAASTPPSSTTPAAAQSAQLDEAAKSLTEGQPEKAEKILTALVAAGNPRAMLQLAGLMMNGVVAGGQGKAIALVQRAADAGDPDAMADMGRMLMLGDGVTKDTAKAQPLLESAVEHGNARAMITLGEALISGPLQPDLPRGEALLRQAAEKGDGNAMADLGMALLNGMLGREPEPQLAVLWLEKGVKAGNIVAEAKLGYLLIAAPHGLTQDAKRGLELVRHAAEAGNPEAMRNVGWLLEHAQPPERDAALVWYERAAAAGDTVAAAERDRIKAGTPPAP